MCHDLPLDELSAGKSEAESVQQYLQRISEGDTPEERQDAVAELRDLLEGRPEVIIKFVHSLIPILIGWHGWVDKGGSLVQSIVIAPSNQPEVYQCRRKQRLGTEAFLCSSMPCGMSAVTWSLCVAFWNALS